MVRWWVSDGQLSLARGTGGLRSKPLSIIFTNIYGARTPPRAYFKLPMCRQRMCKGPGDLTTSSCEQYWPPPLGQSPLHWLLDTPHLQTPPWRRCGENPPSRSPGGQGLVTAVCLLQTHGILVLSTKVSNPSVGLKSSLHHLIYQTRVV